MRIKHKLSLSHGTIVGLMIIQFSLFYMSFSFLKEVLEENIQNKLKSLIQISEIADNLGVIRSEEVNATLIVDIFALEGHLWNIDAGKKKVSEDLKIILDGKSIKGIGQLRTTILQSWNNYQEAFTKTTELVEEGDRESAAKNVKESSLPRYNILRENLKAAIKQVSSNAQESYEYASQFVYNRNLILLILSITGAVVSFILAFFISRSLSVRIDKLRSATRRMEEGDSEPIVVRGNDELSEFAGSFNTMSQKVLTLLRTIEQQNRTLEEKVKERTRHLRVILDSMKQGVFTVDESGVIDKEYSLYLETLLDDQALDGKDLNDALLTSTDLREDKLAMVNNVIFSGIGEEDLTFRMNEHLFPSEFLFETKSGQKKKLEVQWDPILKDGDIVDKILVTLRDVTFLDQLISDKRKNEREVQIITEIIRTDNQKFSSFLASAIEYGKEASEAIEDLRSQEHDEIQNSRKLILRNLHTIKGNSRTLELSELVDDVHRAEQALINIPEDEIGQHIEIVEEQMSVVETSLSEYKIIFEEKIMSSGGGEVSKSDRAIANLSWNFLQKSENLSFLEEYIETLREFRFEVELVSGTPLAELINDEGQALMRLANDLDKCEPQLVVKGPSLPVKRSYKGRFQDILGHILKNNVYHGLENLEERKEAGKNPEGHICVNIRSSEEAVELAISDDGRGLNLAALRSKFGNINDDLELAQKIFESGLSTSEQVTDVAGRGVGLDAVKRFTEVLGGNIAINFLDELVGESYRRFQLKLTFPLSLFVHESEIGANELHLKAS